MFFSSWAYMFFHTRVRLAAVWTHKIPGCAQTKPTEFSFMWISLSPGLFAYKELGNKHLYQGTVGE